MPISYNSPLDSAVANATFLDKTIDDETVGVLGLNNPLATSGDPIANTQREINLSRKIIFGEAIKANGDTITLDTISVNQEARLIGDGAPVSLNVLPFGASKSVEDGCEITLVGHSDVSTITLALNDVDYGCYINGNATLKRGYILKLVYNDELKRYLELGRNF